MRGHLQLFHQAADDVFLERPFKHDIEDADACMFRREPLNSANALLDYHRIPRQVEIHEYIGDLQVDAL